MSMMELKILRLLLDNEAGTHVCYNLGRPTTRTQIQDYPGEIGLTARTERPTIGQIRCQRGHDKQRGTRDLILGINGDPLALAAIAAGRMTATVETDVDDIATRAVDLAYRAARGESLPPHFRNDQRKSDRIERRRRARTIRWIESWTNTARAVVPQRHVGCWDSNRHDRHSARE
jgi:hypothetical protein